jgi:hypothetical protein
MSTHRSSAMDSDRTAAKRRHPATGWQPDLGRMAERMAGRLRGEGHPWPEYAAALLAERGRLGLDRAAFAARLGMDHEMLVALEDGGVPAAGERTRVSGAGGARGHPASTCRAT